MSKPIVEKVEKKVNAAQPKEVSPLGAKIRALREKAEKEPGFKPLNREEIRKEVRRRRTGDFNE